MRVPPHCISLKWRWIAASLVSTKAHRLVAPALARTPADQSRAERWRWRRPSCARAPRFGRLIIGATSASAIYHTLTPRCLTSFVSQSQSPSPPFTHKLVIVPITHSAASRSPIIPNGYSNPGAGAWRDVTERRRPARDSPQKWLVITDIIPSLPLISHKPVTDNKRRHRRLQRRSVLGAVALGYALPKSRALIRRHLGARDISGS